MRFSNAIAKIGSVILWFGMSVGCAADNSANINGDKQPKETYYLEQSEKIPSLGEVCTSFLKVLNEQGRDKLYQDVFLNTLKDYDGFSPMKWERIEGGEEKYGHVLIKRIEMDTKPELISEYVENFPNFKEKLGGFDYYLTYADVLKNEEKLPVIFYVAKQLRALDKRPYFNYMVMENDLSGPNNRLYQGSRKMLTPSYDRQLFYYNGKTYVLGIIGSGLQLIEINRNLASCSYSIAK